MPDEGGKLIQFYLDPATYGELIALAKARGWSHPSGRVDLSRAMRAILNAYLRWTRPSAKREGLA